MHAQQQQDILYVKKINKTFSTKVFAEVTETSLNILCAFFGVLS